MTTTSQRLPLRRALLSVTDKTHLLDLAAALVAAGVEIVSTGGTARVLREGGIPVVELQDYTGFPELMDGRVKTLHPRIHGGLLGRRGVDDGAMAHHDIPPIDLLVVNLYAFEAVAAEPLETQTRDPQAQLLRAVEHIDIGGPALLRAAAKNYAAVAAVVDPEDYPSIQEVLPLGGTDLAQRYALAAKAFAHTARYDAAVANYLGRRDCHGQATEPFPEHLSHQWVRHQTLRYGENPHQRAAVYRPSPPVPQTLTSARLHQGKALSYNNLLDSDAALACVRRFEEPACVIVKHANPCGVAVAPTPLEAYGLAYRTDPTSAFGGIIAFNRPLDAQVVETILARQFVEVLLAPHFEAAALERTAAKPHLRCLAWDVERFSPTAEAAGDYRSIQGGLLLQEPDPAHDPRETMTVVSRRSPSAAEWRDLLFAWQVVPFVKSNAIVYARGQATLGVGAGQMSRVVAARIAALKAADEGLDLRGGVMASDAFFPFRDGVDQGAAAGIGAVIQPGGSVRDDEVIAAADQHHMAMVFTHKRHFRH